MKSVMLQNSIIGEQNGIEIDTICLTKKHRVVKVKSFSGSKIGYCYAVHSWCLDDMFNKYSFSFGKLFNFPRTGYVSNQHKITALKPISSLKIHSFCEFGAKYGNNALIDLYIMQGLIQSFKPQNKIIESQNSKKIKEAAKILRDLIENKMFANNLFQ